MSRGEMITLAAAMIAFAASVIATTVSAFNARFAKFAQMRWWERKADAYARIIEALSQMVYHDEELLSAAVGLRDIPESTRAEIDKHWDRSYSELRTATAVGTFVISADAEVALKKLWQERSKGAGVNDWYGLVESDCVAARACLKRVVSSAKADLQRSPW